MFLLPANKSQGQEYALSAKGKNLPAKSKKEVEQGIMNYYIFDRYKYISQWLYFPKKLSGFGKKILL